MRAVTSIAFGTTSAVYFFSIATTLAKGINTYHINTVGHAGKTFVSLITLAKKQM